MKSYLIIFGTIVFIIAYHIREKNNRKRLEFINQLKSHRSELRKGGTVVVDSMLLRYDSLISTFYLNVGVLFMNIIIPSTYKKKEEIEPFKPLFFSA